MELMKLENSLKAIIRSALSTKTTSKLITVAHFYSQHQRTEALSLANSLRDKYAGFLAAAGWILKFSEEIKGDDRCCIFFSLHLPEVGESISATSIPETFLPSKKEVEEQQSKVKEMVDRISSDRMILSWCEMSLASAIKNSISFGLTDVTWSVPKQDLLSICSARYEDEGMQEAIAVIAEACMKKMKSHAINIYPRVELRHVSNAEKQQGEISQLVISLE